MDNPIKQFSELFSSPLGDLIASIGRGVGEAQAALDEGSLRQTLELYKLESEKEIEEKNKNKSVDELAVINEERRLTQLIREIGYQPTFYVIPETEVEARISLNLNINSRQSNSPGTNQFQPYPTAKYMASATPLNANNVNQYNLDATASATLKFKIIPVPPPTGVSEKRIMPLLEGRAFDDKTVALMASIGLSYILTESSIKLLNDIDDDATLKILKQSIDPDLIIDIGAEVMLTLQLAI